MHIVRPVLIKNAHHSIGVHFIDRHRDDGMPGSEACIVGRVFLRLGRLFANEPAPKAALMLGLARPVFLVGGLVLGVVLDGRGRDLGVFEIPDCRFGDRGRVEGGGSRGGRESLLMRGGASPSLRRKGHLPASCSSRASFISYSFRHSRMSASKRLASGSEIRSHGDPKHHDEGLLPHNPFPALQNMPLRRAREAIHSRSPDTIAALAVARPRQLPSALPARIPAPALLPEPVAPYATRRSSGSQRKPCSFASAASASAAFLSVT